MSQNQNGNKLKGLIVSIYKNDYDGTLNGVTSKARDALLVGEGVAQVFEEDESRRPTLKLVKRNIGGKEYLHAEPVYPKKQGITMSGGNFVYTHDSRFPNRYPISVHDRIETQEEYNHYSA